VRGIVNGVIEDVVGVDTVEGEGGSQQTAFSLQRHLMPFDLGAGQHRAVVCDVDAAW